MAMLKPFSRPPMVRTKQTSQGITTDHRGLALRPLTDDLEEYVRALLAWGKKPQLATTPSSGRW